MYIEEGTMEGGEGGRKGRKVNGALRNQVRFYSVRTCTMSKNR